MSAQNSADPQTILSEMQELRIDVVSLRDVVAREIVALHNTIIDLGKALDKQLTDIQDPIKR